MKENFKIYLKRIFVTAVVVISFAGGWDRLHTVHRSARSDQIKITAHRGDSGHVTENTLPAIESAIGKNADYAEVDVRLTADGELVLMHDASAKRTAGLEKVVEQCRMTDLDSTAAKIRIPTLKEVLLLSKNQIGLNIEIKGDGSNTEVATRVADLVEQFDMTSECVITSCDYEYLKTVKAKNPKIRTGIILSDLSDWRSYQDVDFYSVCLNSCDADEIQAMKKANKEVHVWTVNEPDEIRMAIELGIDNIITDVPHETRQLVRNL